MSKLNEFEFIRHGKLFTVAFWVFTGVISVIFFLCFSISFPKKLPGKPVFESGNKSGILIWKSSEEVTVKKHAKILIVIDGKEFLGVVDSTLKNGAIIISSKENKNLDFQTIKNSKNLEVSYYQNLLSFLLDKN